MLTEATNSTVSRRRYDRQKRAREEAEALLDQKSRALWDANQKLQTQAVELEKTVERRTAALHKATRAAQASNDAKTIFLASMSHEIRTPLNGVLGMAEALSETPLEHEQAEMAQMIVDSGKTLLSILNDILDISKMEAGQLEIEEIGFDVQDVFASIKQLYRLTADEKGIFLEIDVQPSAQCWVLSDPTRIRQVAGNLISNAIKFTDKGGVLVVVKISETPNGQELSIAVKDSGIGIPKDKIAKLAKPFQQVDSSTNRKYGGTGLGLAISKQICGLMGGALSIESVDKQGSVFTATIKVGLAAPHLANTPQDVSRLHAILNTQKWRILVAEDNRTNQLVLKKQLKDFDFAVTFVADGSEAVSALEDAIFDIILMDINMPQMGGVEASSRIRAKEKKAGIPQTPIIALTANSMTHQIESYLKSGMNRHLSKPMKKAELLSAIALTLEEIYQS